MVINLHSLISRILTQNSAMRVGISTKIGFSRPAAAMSTIFAVILTISYNNLCAQALDKVIVNIFAAYCQAWVPFKK